MEMMLRFGFGIIRSSGFRDIYVMLTANLRGMGKSDRSGRDKNADWRVS
jgi:hypothetical protein